MGVIVHNVPVQLVGLPGTCRREDMDDGTVRFVFDDATAARAFYEACVTGKLAIVYVPQIRGGA